MFEIIGGTLNGKNYSAMIHLTNGYIDSDSFTPIDCNYAVFGHYVLEGHCSSKSWDGTWDGDAMLVFDTGLKLIDAVDLNIPDDMSNNDEAYKECFDNAVRAYITENKPLKNELTDFHVTERNEDYDNIIIEANVDNYYKKCFERSFMLSVIKDVCPDFERRFSGKFDDIFDYLLYETDTTFYTYAMYDDNGNIELELVMESNDLGWHDKAVPLTDDEKRELDALPEMQVLRKKINV